MKSVAILLGIFSPLFAIKDYTGHQLVRFNISQDGELSEIKSFVEKDQLDNWTPVKLGSVDLHLTPEQAKLIPTTLKYEVKMDNIQKYIDLERTTGVDRVAAAEFTETYHSYADISSWMEGVVSRSNGTASLFNIGSSYEKRAIKGIRFAKPGPKKRAIFFHGGIHAREWIGVSTIVFIIDEFAKGNDAEAKKLLDSFEFHFIPVLNVDGYEYSRNGDRMWRKNRQPTPRSGCIGTDPNRNWGGNWRSGVGKECTEAYPGPSAFSSPEIKAVSDYILATKPIVHVDIHSYGQMFMGPYGYSCSKSPADASDQDAAAKEAVRAISKVNNNRYKQGSICNVIYQAFGSSVDWSYDVAKVKYPYGVELPDLGTYGFILPASYIPSTGREIFSGLKALSAFVKVKEAL